MNNFEKAYKKLVQFEGGYVNDPDDKGGETYKGIARNFNPNLEVWDIIDYERPNINFPECLEEDQHLQNRVKQFYKENYWDVFKADNLPYNIAEELFEIAVNTGVMRATLILQETINLLNRNQKLYSNIKVDGKFGQYTLSALKACLSHNGEKLVFNVLNMQQGKFYLELMIGNEVYEKYIGWFSRVEILK